jgi:hypothetical protein
MIELIEKIVIILELGFMSVEIRRHGRHPCLIRAGEKGRREPNWIKAYPFSPVFPVPSFLSPKPTIIKKAILNV